MIEMSKIIQMINRGMITIPVALRKKYNLKDGQRFIISEEEGKIYIVPLINFEQERKNFMNRDEMKKALKKMEELSEEELQQENAPIL